VPEKTRKVKVRINDALMSAMGWINGSENPRVGIEARRTKPGARSVLVMWPVPRGKGYAFQKEKGGWRIDLSRFGDYATCASTIVAHRIVGDQLHVETPAYLRMINGTPVNPPQKKQGVREESEFEEHEDDFWGVGAMCPTHISGRHFMVFFTIDRDGARTFTRSFSHEAEVVEFVRGYKRAVQHFGYRIIHGEELELGEKTRRVLSLVPTNTALAPFGDG
jgi:hypothetical protein